MEQLRTLGKNSSTPAPIEKKGDIMTPENYITLLYSMIKLFTKINDFQRMLHTFYLASWTFNIEISITKTKSLVIANVPVRCKVVVEDTIKQVMYVI